MGKPRARPPRWATELERGALVLWGVCWEDAVYVPGLHARAPAHGGMHVYTVGWVVAVRPEGVWLTPHHVVEHATSRSLFYIPRGCIREVFWFTQKGMRRIDVDRDWGEATYGGAQVDSACD